MLLVRQGQSGSWRLAKMQQLQRKQTTALQKQKNWSGESNVGSFPPCVVSCTAECVWYLHVYSQKGMSLGDGEN